MKKISLLLFSHIIIYTSTAQTIERDLIGSTGNVYADASINISYTVGEVTIGGVSFGSFIVTQGFQQDNDSNELSTQTIVKNKINYKLFPNPSTNKIFLEIEPEYPIAMKLRIISLSGVTMYEEDAECNKGSLYIQKEIDVSSYTSGQYFLIMTGGQETYYSIKFSKI